jgi:putative transposase
LAYGYLLKRIHEVAEEYSTAVSFIGEEKTSSKCPIHGDGCGKRIKRGLFKCERLKKGFNTSGSCLQHSHNPEF